MKIGVPGEFHEDRWQRTEEGSERCMLPRTRKVGGTHRYKLSRGEGGFWTVFGTAPLPTGTSVPSSRGEGKEIGTVDGIKVGFTTGFGTATLPTDASVAASRSHCELVYRIVAELGFVKFTWHEPLLIIK